MWALASSVGLELVDLPGILYGDGCLLNRLCAEVFSELLEFSSPELELDALLVGLSLGLEFDFDVEFGHSEFLVLLDSQLNVGLLELLLDQDACWDWGGIGCCETSTEE